MVGKPAPRLDGLVRGSLRRDESLRRRRERVEGARQVQPDAEDVAAVRAAARKEVRRLTDLSIKFDFYSFDFGYLSV